MALWTNISTGFDAEEETVNFGTRTVSENEKAIFEICTLATIQPQHEVVKNPHVIAASCVTGIVCVAIDTSIAVFADEVCSEILFTYNFNSLIDCITLSDDGTFIIVGIGSDVHCLYCSSEGQLLFSRSVSPVVNNDDLVIIKIFIHMNNSHIYDVFVIANSGQIFRIALPNFEILSELIKEGNISDLKEMTDAIQVETIRNECCRSQVSSVTLLTTSENIKFVLVSNEITVWSVGSSASESWTLEKPISRIKSIITIENSSMLVGITEDAKLLIICSQTLLPLAIWDEIPVQDIALLEGMSAEGESAGLLLLTQPNKHGDCYIEHVSLPGLKTKFRFCVSSTTFSVSLFSMTQELLYIEGVGSPNSEFIQSLRIRNIVESQPEDRFRRLLRRRKFDDAKDFACRFNLNVELVYKEHVKHYMELLQPWSLSRNPSDDEMNFNKFVNLLDNIQDIEFVCEACMKAITTDLTKTQLLLDYASNRLKKTDTGHLNTTRMPSLKSQLWNLSLRLDTFLLVYQSDPDNLEWCKFSRSNLLNVCKRHLQRGELCQASIIWMRHWHSLKSLISEDTISDMLNAIPTGVRATELSSWLQHFIPSALCVNPKALQLVVEWAIKLIRSMEVDKVNWPKSGLKFAVNLFRALKPESNSRLDMLDQQRFTSGLYYTELIVIMNALRELIQLKETHKIHIGLADFMQCNKSEVVSILLGKVAPMDIQSLMELFLSNFMLNNSMASDTVLFDYIHGILSQTASWWYYYAEAPWEATVAAVIPCIHNLEIQIKCITSALKMAPVPWSSTMSNIAKRGLEIDHSMIDLIRHEQKMMEVKIVQKKYGFTKLLLEKCNHYDLTRSIRMIFKQGHKDMLEDALKIATVSTKMMDETYILCIEHYLEIGNQRKALQILDGLKPELMAKCCQRIVFKTESYLQVECNNKIRSLYMEVLSALGTRLQKIACILGDKSLIEDIPVEEITNIHLLQMKFGKRLSLKAYSCVQTRMRILSECIEDLLSNMGDVYEIYCKVGYLTRLLELPPEEGILQLCHQALQTGNVLLVYSAIRNLLQFDLVLKCMHSKLCVMIFQFLQASCSVSQSHTALQLVYSIASEACTACSSDVLDSWLQLLQWVYTIQNITTPCEKDEEFKMLLSKPQDAVMKWHFTPLYKDPAIFSTNNQVLSFLQEVGRLYLETTMHFNIDQLQLEKITKQLQQQQRDLGAVRLCCSLNSWALSRSNIPQSALLLLETEKVTCQSVHVLLRKVVSVRRLDVNLGLALLFFLGIDTSYQWLLDHLDSFKQDYQKLSAVAHLGVLLCDICNLDNKSFLIVHIRCMWAKKISEYGVPYVEAFAVGNSLKVLQSLVQLKHVDISLILKYCSDFELDLQECLVLCLQTILLNWEPEFEVEKTVNGEEVLHVKGIEPEVAMKCQNIIELIENKNNLEKCLTLIFNKLNCYYYEMHIYVINLLEQLVPSHNFIGKKVLLIFLKKYKRVQCPKQEELEEWLHHFPQSFTLPLISNWRLPFLPFMEKKIWNILTPELNLNTYKQWLEVLGTLGIEKNNICSVTIRQTMLNKSTENLQASKDSWCVYSQDSIFLNQLDECVNNLNNLEMASACMYFVMNHTPSGADKVTAAKLCYKHTKNWAEEDGSVHAKESLMKVKFKYLWFATTHILHQYGLGIPNYLQLVSKPPELMSALYQDSSIITRIKGHTTHYPDINSAIKTLTVLHGVNHFKFCLHQLNKWLQPNGIEPCLLDDTCDLTRLLQHPQVIGNNEDDLLRACYILKGEIGSMLANHLLKLVFMSGYNECTLGVQFRALQCLMAVTCTKELEEFTGRNIDNIRQILRNLKYASGLEMLGYSYSIPCFESCNKLELVKGIWKSHNNNPQALVLMARLCVEFDVQQHVIWTSLLKKMVKYALLRELESLLLHLADQAHILSSTEYVGAWESVLFTPFVKGQDEDSCIHSLILLQSCPVLRNVKLNVIIDHSLQFTRPDYAAVVLPFLKREELNLVKEKIISLRGEMDLLKDLQILYNKGVLIAEKAIQLIHPGENELVNDTCH